MIETNDLSKFKRGEEIELTMREPADNKFMSLNVRVTHVDKNGIGVEFINVIPEDQKILRACFNLFQHSLPKIES